MCDLVERHLDPLLLSSVHETDHVVGKPANFIVKCKLYTCIAGPFQGVKILRIQSKKILTDVGRIQVYVVIIIAGVNILQTEAEHITLKNDLYWLLLASLLLT